MKKIPKKVKKNTAIKILRGVLIFLYIIFFILMFRRGFSLVELFEKGATLFLCCINVSVFALYYIVTSDCKDRGVFIEKEIKYLNWLVIFPAIFLMILGVFLMLFWTDVSIVEAYTNYMTVTSFPISLLCVSIIIHILSKR